MMFQVINTGGATIVQRDKSQIRLLPDEENKEGQKRAGARWYNNFFNAVVGNNTPRYSEEIGHFQNQLKAALEGRKQTNAQRQHTCN